MDLYVHESETARRRDLRLATLPSRFEQMLDGLVELPAFDLRRLEGAVSRVKEMCDELAGYGLPETIQHDDSTTARCSYAMAATCWSIGKRVRLHPFFTLSVTPRHTSA
jgi:hypothetical protein